METEKRDNKQVIGADGVQERRIKKRKSDDSRMGALYSLQH